MIKVRELLEQLDIAAVIGSEMGRQVLFIKQCIDGLRAIANDADASLSGPVATFLGKKGHIEVNPETGKTDISVRGRECLADIDANAKSN